MAALMFSRWLLPEGLVVESMRWEPDSLTSPPALPQAMRLVPPVAADRDGSTAAISGTSRICRVLAAC